MTKLSMVPLRLIPFTSCFCLSEQAMSDHVCRMLRLHKPREEGTCQSIGGLSRYQTSSSIPSNQTWQWNMRHLLRWFSLWNSFQPAAVEYRRINRMKNPMSSHWTSHEKSHEIPIVDGLISLISHEIPWNPMKVDGIISVLSVCCSLSTNPKPNPDRTPTSSPWSRSPISCWRMWAWSIPSDPTCRRAGPSLDNPWQTTALVIYIMYIYIYITYILYIYIYIIYITYYIYILHISYIYIYIYCISVATGTN